MPTTLEGHQLIRGFPSGVPTQQHQHPRVTGRSITNLPLSTVPLAVQENLGAALEPNPCSQTPMWRAEMEFAGGWERSHQPLLWASPLPFEHTKLSLPWGAK
jgi:hypothetical protein